MKKLIKQMFRQLGYDIRKRPANPFVRQQMDLIRKYDVNLVFDVGANAGQFGRRLRDMGFKGRIVSFEPLPDAFERLNSVAAADPAWTAVHTAIGSSTGETRMNVSQNSFSSSILEMLPAHLESAPESVYTHQINVPIQTLDSLIETYYTDDARLYVKVDTQGFEREVLEGSLRSLDKIRAFQMELSVVPLYKNEMLMYEMVGLLQGYGFKLMLIEGGHRHYKTGELLQVECYFYRNELAC